MGYKEDIEINRHKLDEEIINQPVLYLEWAQKASEAMAHKQRTEQKRKLIKAELDKKYREQFESNGEKYTEAKLDSYIRSDKEFKNATDEYIDAMEQEQIYADVKWAFQQRKSSLELLQEGIINGIYADPRNTTTQKAISEHLNKRKKRDE